MTLTHKEKPKPTKYGKEKVNRMTIKRDELGEYYGKAEGTIHIPIKYTLEDLECALISAWEGGSNYWVGKAEVKHPSITIEEAHGSGWCTSEWAFHALVEGGSIYFEDNEDGEDKGELTLEGMKKGLELFVKNCARNNHVNFFNFDGTLDMGQVDAVDADMILQYSLWGKVIFG